MTTNAPSTGNCPAWDNETIPPHLEGEFKASLAQIRQEISDFARRALIAPDDVRGWHRTIFRKLVPVPYYAGHFRGIDPVRPCLAQDNQVGTIPGSPFAVVSQDVRMLFGVIRSQFTMLEIAWSTITPADRASRLAAIIANFVGGFIRIHPFVNGNGRSSRLLWMWCQMRFGVRPQCRIHPRPPDPYNSIMGDAMAGNYGPLYLFVLRHFVANAPAQTATS